MSACARACACACARACMCVCVCVCCTHMYMYMYVYICTYSSVCTCTYMYMCTCHVHVYMSCTWLFMIIHVHTIIGPPSLPPSLLLPERSRLPPRGRNIQSGLFGRGFTPALGCCGVVFFSDVTQLRAALKEMQQFRLLSSLSRNTGFGQTQSVSFLK